MVALPDTAHERVHSQPLGVCLLTSAVILDLCLVVLAHVDHPEGVGQTRPLNTHCHPRTHPAGECYQEGGPTYIYR